MARQWPAATAAELDAPSVGARHVPLSDAVVDELRSAIIGGEYAQGERLVEEEVAARFEVSRNPIREALRTLSTEGFVVIEPRRGARVASMDAVRAGELFELRAPLEGLVAGLAAQRCTAAQLDRLDDLVVAGRSAATDGRLHELPALNTQFHDSLASAAGNELLRATL